MSIYAVADLHLSLSPEVNKPMDIYGPRWYEHVRRLKENWCSTINEEDTVIVPGDISWGLKLEDAMYDLEWLAALPGHKVIFKGNHDLWWKSITKLNKMYENMTFVQNDFYFAEDVYICGSRGGLPLTMTIILRLMRKSIRERRRDLEILLARLQGICRSVMEKKRQRIRKTRRQ